MTKKFFPTYLYIKTHNITGLKYFGKTTQDPYTYRGSGKHWLAHIKKHGNDVTTEIYGFYCDKNECMQDATSFSAVYNIVESPEWANLIPENGIDGGATSWGPHNDSTKQKISEARKGTPLSEETKEKIRQKRKNQDMSHMRSPKSEETKEKIRQSLKGRVQSHEAVRKRSVALQGHEVSEETRRKISLSHLGKIISEETKQKIRESKKNNPMSEEQREKLSEMYKGKVWSEEEKQKIRGQIVVVDRAGNLIKIAVETYKQQLGVDCDYVHFRTEEGKRRRLAANEQRPS